jgi:predicted RND superfamily exporter protein
MQLGEIAAEQKEIISAVASPPVATLSWTHSQTVSSPGKTLTVAAVIALTALSAFLLFHSLLASFISASVIFLSVGESLVPLSYCMDKEMVIVKIGLFHWLEMPISSIKSTYNTQRGIKLSVFESPKMARFEPYRGIELRFGLEMRTRVEAFLAKVITAP